MKMLPGLATSKVLRNIVFFAMSSGAIKAYSQEFTGHVTDQTGAVLAKVFIMVHNVQTNGDVKTATTAAGAYTVPYLKPGLYTRGYA